MWNSTEMKKASLHGKTYMRRAHTISCRVWDQKRKTSLFAAKFEPSALAARLPATLVGTLPVVHACGHQQLLGGRVLDKR
jgi:hypothetical protein